MNQNIGYSKMYYQQAKHTLNSGIDVATGINVAPGIFGKNIKHSPWNRNPTHYQIVDILKKNMH